jgi:7-cyano-7-deazaguanine synthase
VSLAVCLLSGGMDSVVAAALQREEGYRLATLSVDYGQRHRVELEAAARLSEWLGAERHLVVRVAGYSAYFTELDRGLQDEIIRRTEFS